MADGGAAARSALIRHHLGLWADWNTAGGDPWGGIFQGAVDLDQVVLVGHSRGGEGVERAAVDASPADGYTIVGLVPIGPTSFGRQVGAGIATAVILPYCDGDVVDLQGQIYIDQSRDLTRDRALRSAVLVIGTNHNFYNTEWTPGLAAGPRRRRLAVGRAGRRAHLRARGDRAADPRGAAGRRRHLHRRPGAGGGGARCRRGHAARRHPGPGRFGRTGPRPHPRPGRPAHPGLQASPGRLDQHHRPVGPGLPGLHDRATGASSRSVTRSASTACPTGLPMMGVESAPSPLALELQWWRTGGTARLTLPRAKNLSQATGLDLRLAVDVAFSSVDLGVRLIDRRGSTVDLPAAYRVPSLPGNRLATGEDLGPDPALRPHRGAGRHRPLADHRHRTGVPLRPGPCLAARRARPPAGGHGLGAHRPPPGERGHRSRSPREARAPEWSTCRSRSAATSSAPPSSGCRCSPPTARRATAWCCRRAPPKPASRSPSRGTTSSTRRPASTAW